MAPISTPAVAKRVESIDDCCLSNWPKGISQKASTEAKIWRLSSCVPNCWHTGKKLPILQGLERWEGNINHWPTQYFALNILLKKGKILCGDYYFDVATTDVDCNGVSRQIVVIQYGASRWKQSIMKMFCLSDPPDPYLFGKRTLIPFEYQERIF